MRAIVISIDNVTFCYRDGNFRLSVACFQVSSGSAVAVVGPSGSGKTTLLNLAAGILVPASGQVRTNDITISSVSESERRDFRIANIGAGLSRVRIVGALECLG